MRDPIRYAFKNFLRNRSVIIWILLFPLAYFGIYYAAISGTVDPDNYKLDPVKVGILLEEEEGEKKNQELKLPTLTSQQWEEIGEEVPLIHLDQFSHDKEALEGALREEKLDAYFYAREDGRYDFVMGKNSRQMATILQEVLTTLNSFSATGLSIQQGVEEGKFKIDPAVLLEKSKEGEGKKEETAESMVEMTTDREGINPYYIFFFSALAYLAFYPIHSGLMIMEATEADQSPQALRRAISPLSKRSIFLTSFLPVTLVTLLTTFLAYGFSLLLGVDYGPEHGWIILLLFLGNMAAILTGTCLGSLFPKQEGLKTGLAVGVPLLFSMVSGMMAPQINQAVRHHIPWLYYYNPLGMIAHGLYVLYREGASARYFTSVYGLLIYCLLALLITLFYQRRRSYESL